MALREPAIFRLVTPLPSPSGVRSTDPSGTADASLADFSESWAFYDHTQYYTCAAMAVVAGQALLAKGG